MAPETNVVVLRGGECAAAIGDDELRDTYSVTKTVVSTLVGIALARGDVRTVEPWRPLLTMTAGFSGEIDDVMALDTSWEQAIRAWPRLPAGTFRYDNGTAHLLACELARALRTPLDAYAAEVLFAPLGIDRWLWPRDPEGYAFGFGHLRLRTRDLARIGEAWRVGALVDPAYRAEATRAWTPGGPPEHRPYGCLWWISPRGFFGAGYAGQLLWVAGDAVVAVNAGEAYAC
ncbi:MAG TPA: serine hydrolase domain-containing protein [Gaiellaceae bacterium]|nr:serine hydrolase domain-containing protein [Gaiellaceae bacterium]